jgi:hypothetical protein
VGRVGFTLYEVTAPPLLVGLFAVMGDPTWYLAAGVLYVSPDGGCGVGVGAGVLPPPHPHIERNTVIKKGDVHCVGRIKALQLVCYRRRVLARPSAMPERGDRIPIARQIGAWGLCASEVLKKMSRW